MLRKSENEEREREREQAQMPRHAEEDLRRVKQLLTSNKSTRDAANPQKRKIRSESNRRERERGRGKDREVKRKK